MPKYEFHCAYCNKRFEVEKSYTDTSPISCPKCGKTNRLVQIISKPPAVKYKGEGFTKKVEGND